MNALRNISKRLRELEVPNAEAASVYYERLTAQAAEYLSTHWLEEFNKFPFPQTTPSRQDDPGEWFRVWSNAFTCIAFGLRCDFPGEIPEAGIGRIAHVFRAESDNRTAKLVHTGFFQHADDWKMRTLDAADVCEWVADRLEKSHEQLEHLEQPKISHGLKLPTNGDIAEVWNTVQAAEGQRANVADICRTIAEKQGGTELQIKSRAESIRVQFNRWRRNNIG